MSTSTMTTDETNRSTHPVHVGHLVMGLAFLGLVGIWAAVQYAGVSSDDLRWLLPLPWVFAGGAGLLAVTLSGRRGTPAPPPVAATAADTTTDFTVDTDVDHDPSEENR